jgi:hypothetical protein
MMRLVRILVVLAALGAVGRASEPPRDPTRDSEGFEPVAGDMMARGETIPANRLVAAAYGFIFATLVVYVAGVAARARRVEEELAALKRKLDEKAR